MLSLVSGCGPGPKTAGSSGPGEIKTVVTIGVQGVTNVLNFARDRGLFEQAFAKAGAQVQWAEFASGPPHLEAIASGRLDFGATGGTPVISGQVGGVDFKAIAVTGDGKKGNAIVLPRNSAIRNVQDLKGKKIAVAKGSSAYYFLYLVLEKAALTEKDVQIIQLQPDEARPALDSGAVDAWSVWEPYITAAVVQSNAKVLVSGQDYNVLSPGFLIARTKFLQDHPDLTNIFLKTYEQARLELLRDLEAAAEQFAKAKKLDKSIISPVLRNADYILQPISQEYAQAHQQQADFLYRAGAITKQLETSRVLSSSEVERALLELKEGK